MNENIVNMKISKIKIDKLFGSFDHEVDFKIKEGITLMLGQNGIGKTVLLNIIKSIFDCDFYNVMDIAFEKITISFDNATSWEFEKQIKEEHEELVLKLIKNKKVVDSQLFSDITEKSEKMLRELRNYLPAPFRRTDDNEWLDRRTGEKFSTKEIIDKHRENLPPEAFNTFLSFPTWFSEIVEGYKVNLIETQRLLTFIQTDERYNRPHLEYRNTVEEYSKELIVDINSKLANSSELSTKLDRTYPNRLIERLNAISEITQKELNSKLTKLEEKRTRLEKVGLLDLKKEPRLLSIQKEQDSAIKEVLLVYIEDSNQKLEVYDELADKIELFLQIINERFLYKKLSINKDGGFCFSSLKNKQPIPLKKLSSGEQHLLVLFYQLLFKYPKNTLLLIDEPEISLHISWQKNFISDLKKILKLNKMDILIATHSPSIIGKDWELTVDLDEK